MRMRTISPQIWANEELGSMGGDGVLLFVGLWMLADREGRLKDRPRWIGAQIFPYRDVPVENLLNELSANGFVSRYEAEGGRYLEIVNFRKYQKPHANEAASRIPPSQFRQCTKPLQPLAEAALAIDGTDFASDSLIHGFSENGESDSLTPPSAPARDEPNPNLAAMDEAEFNGATSGGTTPEAEPANLRVIPNRLGEELTRLEADAEARWPKRAAIEQGMDLIRGWVGSRASPVAALIDVRRGFELWLAALPPDGLDADDVDAWPNLETWAKKQLWKDPPRRERGMRRRARRADEGDALLEQVRRGVALAASGGAGRRM